MDAPEFLKITQDQNIFNVSVYSDVDENHYDYDTPEAITQEPNEDIVEPNLRVTSNLFESRPEDLLSVKIEHVDSSEQHGSATEDESMAVEALRQLGNSSYAPNKSPRIETTTPHDLPLLPCMKCDLEFRTTSDLNTHAEICAPTQFQCHICNEVFDRKLDFNNHLVCHAVDRPHACRICSTLFIDKADLQQHTLTHAPHRSEQTNQCNICGQQFSRPSSLSNHIKIHGYQPGRSMLNEKIEGTTELTDILTGHDAEMQPIQKITLPSINNITPMNNWNLCYEPENFNTDINLEVPEGMNNLEEKVVVEEITIMNLHQTLEDTNKKPYSCTRCAKSFAREKALQNHLKLHKAVLDNFYVCERCDQNFNNSNALERHLQFCGIKTKSKDVKVAVVSNVVPIKKKENNKTPKPSDFENDSTFDVNVYNKIYKHKCTECDKSFTTKQKLYRHMWIHRKKVYSCELCPKTFEQQELLDAHRLSTHQSGSPYVCPECGKNFSSRQGLWEHNRIHTTDTNSFRCVECAKTFTSRQGYLIHKRKHSDERPYGCRFCWKAFRDGGTLRKHERIHTGERPHACPLCSKAFNQKVVLREHVRWLHTAHLTADEEGLYHCSICSCSINDKDELCAHFVKHSDQMAQLAKDASKNNIMIEEQISQQRTQPIASVILPKIEAIQSELNSMDDSEVNIEIPTIEMQQPSDITQDIETSAYIQKIENIPSEKVMIHAEQNVCDLCGNAFSSKADLNKHIRIHI